MELQDRFAEEGWLVFNGLFEREQIDSIRGEYEQQVRRLKSGGRTVERVHVAQKRMIFPIKLRGALLSPQIYANPILLSVIQEYLGENVVIDSFTCVTAFPGAPAQPSHKDHPELFPDDPEARAVVRSYAITVAIPLVDLTEETGTTKVFPFSHRTAVANQFELPFVSRGGCFMMDYRLFHHGTANFGRADRPILYIVYARSWFTDIKNFREFPRLQIDQADLTKIPSQHISLFRRLAARGAFNSTEANLFRNHAAIHNPTPIPKRLRDWLQKLVHKARPG